MQTTMSFFSIDINSFVIAYCCWPRSLALASQFVFLSMVTSARLGWVINQLQIGRQARVKLASYADRMILQITLLTKCDASMSNCLTIAWLHQMRENLASAVSVDHGHRKSSGEAHICIVLRPLPGSSGSFVSKDEELPLAGADVHDMSDGRGTTVSTLGDGLTEAVTLTSTDAFDVKAADAVDEQITQSVSDGVCSSYPMHEAEDVQKDVKLFTLRASRRGHRGRGKVAC